MMREHEKNKGKDGWGQRPPRDMVGEGERVIKVKKRGSREGQARARQGYSWAMLAYG